MINKLIIDGKNVELTDKSQVPFTYTFAQAQTHVVRFGLDNTDEVCAYAFQDCKDLTYISFPPEIKRIKRGAFKGCTSLEKVPIGKDIEYIGKEAFDGCTALKEVQFESSTIPAIYCTLPSNTTIYVPNGSKFNTVDFDDINKDGTVEYFTKTEWNQYRKVEDVTSVNQETQYYINRWNSVADNRHTVEEKDRIPISAINMDENTTMTVGSIILTYTLEPANPTNTNLYWKTSNDAFVIDTNVPNPGTVKVTSPDFAATTQITVYAESGASKKITLRATV